MYYIESKAGLGMGVYPGNTPEAAVRFMNNESGGDSSVRDWTVIPVVASRTLSELASLLELGNGAYMLAIGVYPWRLSYHRTKEDALRAWEKWNPTE